MQNDHTLFSEQIYRAQSLAMRTDKNMIAMGLGITDPKGIFNTTNGLEGEFGHDRVFDIPTSENAMTGIGIGAAIAGSRVLMTHQRVDFFLLALDQLVNNEAKWHHMFTGQMQVPLTIRLIIGRGWGQGPTHQQSLQSWFSHIPGLEVVVPGCTDNVGQLLYQSIMSNNPTVFLEHRWLHNQKLPHAECVPFNVTSNTTRVLRTGKDITLIANSYMLLEALRAAETLLSHNIKAEVIEIASPSHIDWSVIFESVEKTGHCLIAEIGHVSFSVASEVSAKITENCFTQLKKPPLRLGLPDIPEPTSFGLTKHYYKEHDDILNAIASLLDQDILFTPNQTQLHDVPGKWFTGPF